MINYLSQQDILSDINAGYNSSNHNAGWFLTILRKNLIIGNIAKVYIQGVLPTRLISDSQPLVWKIQKFGILVAYPKFEHHIPDIS